MRCGIFCYKMNRIDRVELDYGSILSSIVSCWIELSQYNAQLLNLVSFYIKVKKRKVLSHDIAQLSGSVLCVYFAQLDRFTIVINNYIKC